MDLDVFVSNKSAPSLSLSSTRRTFPPVDCCHVMTGIGANLSTEGFLQGVDMVWCLWTAILAAMPQGVWSYGPMIPGQSGTAAFATATALFVVHALLAPRLLENQRPSTRIVYRRVVTCIGALATVGFAVSEAYGLVRGDGLLYTEAQISVEYAFMLAEVIFSIISVLCWALVTGASEDHVEHDSPTLLALLFLFGSIVPALCALIASELHIDSRLISLILGSAVFVLALVGSLAWRMHGRTTRHILTLMAGHMAFLSFRGVLDEYRAEYWDSGISDAAFYLFFIVLCAVFLGIVLAWCAHRKKHPDQISPSEDESSGADDKNHTRASHLEVCFKATYPTLTEREAAVLAWSAMGGTAKTIAADLSLAEATVATYRKRGYGKLGVSGIQDLRRLAVELESNDDSLNQDFPVSGSEECKRVQSATTSIPVIVAFGFIVLLFVAVPSNNYQIDDLWFHRGSFVIVWIVSLIFSLVTTARIAFSPHANTALPENSPHRSPILSSLIPIVLVCVLSAGVYCAWNGMWAYRIYGIILLAASSIVVGGQSGDYFSSTVFKLLTGFKTLFIEDNMLPLLSSAILAITYNLELIQLGAVSEWLRIIYPALTFFGLVLAIYIVRETSNVVSKPTNKEFDRAVHYLAGRGVDGLRGLVMADLAFGYSLSEVSKRRCTTPATVKSYRQRTYADLQIHSIVELRELLFSEAKITSLHKLHPHK